VLVADGARRGKQLMILGFLKLLASVEKLKGKLACRRGRGLKCLGFKDYLIYGGRNPPARRNSFGLDDQAKGTCQTAVCKNDKRIGRPGAKERPAVEIHDSWSVGCNEFREGCVVVSRLSRRGWGPRDNRCWVCCLMLRDSANCD